VLNVTGSKKTGGLGELLALAWPIAAAMLGDTVIGLVDTKLVGGLGAAALGGVGIGTMLMFLNYSVVFGLMRGVKVKTAYAVGEGSPADALRYVEAGLLFGAAVGVPVWAIGRDIGWILRALQVDASLVPYAVDFFRAVTWGAPATCMLSALVNHRQALGDARSPMALGLAANVVNAALGYSLIYGHAGLPALGVRGSGYATALAQWIETLALLALLLRDARRAPKPSLALRVAAREVGALGIPTGLHFGAEVLAFTVFTAILGSLGASEIAAHQLALAVNRVSFLPGMAVAEAACVLVGQALGRRSLGEADRVTRSALAAAVTFMAVCGVAFAVLGGAISSAFTSDAAVGAVARRLLLVAALFQVLDAVNVVLRGALRGAKDVRWAAIIGVSIVWTCIPTAALVLGKWCGMGALGGWLGFVAETVFSAALFSLRWKRGGWRNQYDASPV
jgi:MATE family, multidrug efflux pump